MIFIKIWDFDVQERKYGWRNKNIKYPQNYIEYALLFQNAK